MKTIYRIKSGLGLAARGLSSAVCRPPSVYWMILGLGLALGCNQTTPQSGAAPAENNPATAGLQFVFSKLQPAAGADAADNWCRIPFPEAAVISADPTNSNRRLFTLSDGPHKVVVDFGNIVAAFILKKSGNHIDIYTSNNYPECLSNRSNFSIGGDGTTFHYDNQKHINFDIQLVPLPNGIQIALEMAPGAGYGIVVRR